MESLGPYLSGVNPLEQPVLTNTLSLSSSLPPCTHTHTHLFVFDLNFKVGCSAMGKSFGEPCLYATVAYAEFLARALESLGHRAQY